MGTVISFKKRYLFKLATNLVGLAIGIGTQSVVPRALGPAAYGDFSFLTNFFQSVVGFLNMNSSTAFYTRLSQRQQDRGLVLFYLYFTLLLGAVLSILLIFSFSTGIHHLLWPGQAIPYILLGAIWAFLTFCIMILSDMTDAYGLTVNSELVKMAVKVFGFLLIVALFWQNWISLLSFFSYHLFIMLLTMWFLIAVIRRKGPSFSGAWHLQREETTGHVRDFASFCAPLVVFTAFAVFVQILDRWCLQTFSGSVDQGFYGLAFQIGALCFLFASAMIPLVAREFAIAFGNQDIQEMGRVFSRSAPLLYAIVAYFSCFLAVESRNVVLLFGGQAYTGAIVPIAIMCFYPIHQTYGQLNGSVFFATNRTIAYRNIGIFITFIGLPLSYFLLGPRDYGALQAGATGLAAKMVFLQFVSVNIQLWYNTRLMNLSFNYYIGHQLLVIAVFIVIALACSYLVRVVLSDAHFGIQFLTSGFIYTLLIAGVGLSFPRIFALQRKELSHYLSFGKRT
jgi:O-antigen/teichoic acid export membrane protein